MLPVIVTNIRNLNTATKLPSHKKYVAMVRHPLNHLIYHLVLKPKGLVSVAIPTKDKRNIEESMTEE